MLLLAAKTLEETLGENRQGGCEGQGGTPGLHSIRQGSCPVQGEAAPAAPAAPPPSPGILCCVPVCSCGKELQGSPGQPCTAPHGTDAPSRASKEAVPALPLRRGLQQTPPEVPPSSAMCCRAPCIQTRGCTETCSRPGQSQSTRGGEPAEQDLPSAGRWVHKGSVKPAAITNPLH